MSPYDVIGAATDVLLYGTAEQQQQFAMSPEPQRIAACSHGWVANLIWPGEAAASAVARAPF